MIMNCKTILLGISILLICIFIIISIYRLINKKENFTSPNFVQVYNKSGTSPHTVAFLPIYRDRTSFTIDFGDGSSHRFNNEKNNAYIDERFYHTYAKKGNYMGHILFDDSDVDQPFEIIVV